MDLWLIGGGGGCQPVMKIIWCNGLPEIDAWLEGGHQPKVFSVMVFHGSMIDWRREGQGQSVMKIVQCTGLTEIHAQLTGGIHQPKVFSVMVFHGSMVSWRREGWVSLSWKLFGVMVFQRSIVDWLGGGPPVDLPNLSSQMFRCGHHRGLFTSCNTNKNYKLTITKNVK